MVRGENTPGVTGFVGSGNKPIPLTEDEARALLRQMGEEQEEPRVRVDFSEGEAVRVTSGAFKDFEGVIQEVNAERASCGFSCRCSGAKPRWNSTFPLSRSSSA